MFKNIVAKLPMSLLLGVVITIVLNWPIGEILSHPYRILAAVIVALSVTLVMSVALGIIKTLYETR